MAQEEKKSAELDIHGDMDSRWSFAVRYFAFTGRATPIRLALTLGGIAFQDEFVEKDEHKAAKENGERRWSGLPELVVYGDDGKEVTTIGQSLAQLRYVGKVTGLYPSNALPAAFVDEIIDAVTDAVSTLFFHGETDKDKQKAMREAVIAKDGKLTLFLNKFVCRLEENEKRGGKNGFIVGDSLTIADLSLSGALKGLTSGFWDHIPKDLYTKNFPKLAAYIDTVNKNEKIKEFNAKFEQRLTDFKDDAKKKDVKVVTYPGKKAAKEFISNRDKAAGWETFDVESGKKGIQGVLKAVCMLNPDGGSKVSGKVIFETVKGGKTKITAEIIGLTPGKHGFHIHQLGDLSGGCKTAKGHFNPYQQTHGGPGDKVRHVGDLGNIVANDKGVARVDLTDDLVQLNGKNSIIGRSVVVHAGEDDLGKGGHDDSLTTGHAGGRVACGVIGIGN